MSSRYRCCITNILCVSLVFVLGFGSLNAYANTVFGTKGVVSSRSILASEVGIEILRQGGNAVDGAVATAFALAVTYPSAGNLGGGGFAVIYLPSGEAVTNDHRELAPQGAHRDMFLDDAGDYDANLALRSHLSSGVPGAVAGLLDIHERYGELDRKVVMAPAVKLAKEGFVLPDDIAGQFASRQQRWREVPSSAKIFLKPDGSPFAGGETFVQKDLAVTLQRIADQGKQGFYQGKTAALIVEQMARGNGLISLEDLRNYRSVWREPVKINYRGHVIYSMGPPSSGGVLLALLLNMVEAYPLKDKGYGSFESMHLMIEAERRAYADRAMHLGDIDFYPVPLASLTSKAYARSRMRDFDPEKASKSSDIVAGYFADESSETTHFSVYTRDGMAVSFTTTINSGYGSGIVVDGAGFLLNNEMDDFSAKPGAPNASGLLGDEANAIVPKKRMLSSMTPTIVLKDERPFVLTGTPGASTIITTVFQIVTNVIDHDMAIADAVSSPRFHHQWFPDLVVYEKGFSEKSLAALERVGHELSTTPRGAIGDANTIMVTEDEIIGVSDPRNVGRAAGY